jgi:DNA uptake protein ComE-like DNA-binding protein
VESKFNPASRVADRNEELQMRSIGLRTSLALCAVVVAAACTAKSDKQGDTAIVTGDTSMAPTATATTTTPAASTTSSSTAAIVPININTATDAEILAIPGMGPRMLREFKEYRPYTSIEQFRREIGKYVDKAEVARLEQYIVIK